MRMDAGVGVIRGQGGGVASEMNNIDQMAIYHKRPLHKLAKLRECAGTNKKEFMNYEKKNIFFSHVNLLI